MHLFKKFLFFLALVISLVGCVENELSFELNENALNARNKSKNSRVIIPKIALGFNHSCLLRSSGKITCWGRGAEGQLGHGNTKNVGIKDEDNYVVGEEENVISLLEEIDPVDPDPVFGDGPGVYVTNISAGGNRTCVSLSNGRVKCWGQGVHWGHNQYPGSTGGGYNGEISNPFYTIVDRDSTAPAHASTYSSFSVSKDSSLEDELISDIDISKTLTVRL